VEGLDRDPNPLGAPLLGDLLLGRAGPSLLLCEHPPLLFHVLCEHPPLLFHAGASARFPRLPFREHGTTAARICGAISPLGQEP